MEIPEDSEETDDAIGAPLEQGVNPVENPGAQVNAQDDEPQGHGYKLRPKRPIRTDRLRDAIDEPHNQQSYHAPTQLFQVGNVDDQCRYIFGWVMTQMSARVGLRKHGERAEEALLQEFMQMRDLDVYEILDPMKLSHEQKKAALRALNLLQEKRNGKLKGRTVADGRKQRPLYTKSETASPTVSTTALMLTIMVDAYERRDVATADVAGAYLKATMDDYVLIKFVGESVNILLAMEPSYEKLVTVENGNKVLYGRLNKALYGCVKSALLWYNLFHDTLRKMGFTINPYDPCVANSTIEGSQCTIAWYVDDTKISHVNPDVVSRVIETLEGHFGKMTVTRGREHTFLGMNIRYTEEQTAVITMKDYLREAIAESELAITREAATPAKRTLFEVNEQSPKLDNDQARIFHSVTAKLLYVAIRARMDLLLPVCFLGTRVSKSTEEDRGKLQRVLEYVKGTIDQEYVLGASSLTTLRTWVDASFAVHPDMRSHTGGVMSYGRGGFNGKSNKQKLNVTSSTHAEQVGASDYLPNTIWVTKFMTEQGYPPSKNFLEQDNESAIKLATNGRVSAGAKSRHIDIRFFWVKDSTEAMGIKIRHCPTLRMLADFFTKPLQGTLFRTFRDAILGITSINELDQFFLDRPVEERVGILRQDGRGTDCKRVAWADQQIDDEGFILVTGKKPRRKGHVEKNVATSGRQNQIVSRRSFSRNNPVSSE